MSEWRNVNDIIRICFKLLTDTVKNQGLLLRDMNTELSSKPSFDDIASFVNQRSNSNELIINNALKDFVTKTEINSLLDGKLNKKEFFYYIQSKNEKPDLNNVDDFIQEKMNDNTNNLFSQFESLKNELNSKLNSFIKSNEINFKNIQNIIDNKANIADVAEALDLKLDKDNLNIVLDNKIDKSEINKILEKKINKNSLNDITKSMDAKLDKKDFDNFLNEFNMNMNQINELKENFQNKDNDFKVLNDAFQDMKTNLVKRVDEIDTDFDQFIEKIKNQFQSLNVIINSIQDNKNDLNNKLNEKVNKEELNNLLNKVYDEINNFKNNESANKKLYEEKLKDKIDNMFLDNQSIITSLNNANNSLNNYMKQKQAELETLINKMENAISKNEIRDAMIKQDIQKISDMNKNQVYEQLKDKLDINKFEEFLDGLKEDLDNKLNVSAMQKNNDELIKEFNNKIKELYNDLNKELDNKISGNDVKNLLDNKIDIGLLNNKLNINDFNQFKDYIDNIIQNELKQKLDIAKFNGIIQTFNTNFENIHKDISEKASLKDILNLLKKKLNIEDFNKITEMLKNEIDSKISSDDFSNAMDNQAIINDTLCNENSLGRWVWRGGKLRAGLTVPWEGQNINTSPDNFIWEKDKNFVIVNKGGLYELNMGFYSNKKPTVQIMVNDEVIISAINSNSYVIHQSTGGRMKGLGRTSFGNVTGLTLTDFIMLPDKAKISFSYTGEDGVGFFGLKKL